MKIAKERRYHFVSHWTVDAPSEAAYGAIYEVVRYPAWWPEVREVRRLDEAHLWMRTRSFLPYDLAFVLERTVADPSAGILEARLTGHLEGVIRWTVERAVDGCVVTFDEDVILNRPALNRLGAIVRPAYVANHALMMAHGQAGLRTFLATHARSRQEGLRDY